MNVPHPIAHPISPPSLPASAWPNWLADPTSVPFLHAIDFWAGAIGFLITIATFILGWRKLVRVEEATKAASDAVEAVKLRVVRYDAGIDASDALRTYKEVMRHLEDAEWRNLVSSMAEIRRSAVRIDAALDKVDAAAAKQLRKVSTLLAKTMAVVEEAITHSKPLPDDNVLRGQIRTGEETFEKVRRVIEDSL